jgi:hypothetical protein
LGFKKALTIAVLVLALAIASLATARGEDESTNASLHVEVKAHYICALVTYNIMLKGPTTLRQINVSLPSWDNLYASVCEGNYSKFWVKSIELGPGEVYNMSIESLWLFSVEGDRHVLRIPSNPLISSLNADRIEVVISPPPNVNNIDVRGLNFTKIDGVLKSTMRNVPLREARTITVDLTFNATAASPWLFKVKKLVRDVDPLSGTIVDYVTVESLSPTVGWQTGQSQRQSVFCFKFPSEAKILEVGDLAGNFKVAQNEHALSLGYYAISSTNDSVTLYVRPRTSLALGERTTIYIKYLILNAKGLQALPQYADYADEVELRFRLPPGSNVLKASPKPDRRDSTIYYVFHDLSRLQNPMIVVEVSLPATPSVTVMAAGIAGAAAVALGVFVGRRVMAKRVMELEVGVKPFKELFDRYADTARRIWRTHEDYLRGRVKDSTYRKRVQELRPTCLEALKKLTEASKKLEGHPRLSKAAQRVSELVNKASRLEEAMSSFEVMRRSKKVTVAELSQRAEELLKQIEQLRKELHDLASKISKATA